MGKSLGHDQKASLHRSNGTFSYVGLTLGESIPHGKHAQTALAEKTHNAGNEYPEGLRIAQWQTATFMILGNICTRNCRFCAVNHGTPVPSDEEEPERVAFAVDQLGLRYVVITSVTRDDLQDGGAQQFVRTVRAIREKLPQTLVELLVPDFLGNPSSLDIILSIPPDVLNHNVETIPRLYPRVRPQADYRRSLALLERVRSRKAPILTKSGVMLGLGERQSEVIRVMQDLLDVGCKLLTLGQYLQPSRQHYPVIRYLHPEEFEGYKALGEGMGFLEVASGPCVRSSFGAAQMYRDASFR